MNTSFKPSEFDKQAAASLDMLYEQAAAKRVHKILHPHEVHVVGGESGEKALEEQIRREAGPTLTPAPQAQPQAPAPRKKRSDAGIPKGPKVPKGLLEVRFTIEPDSGFALHRWMVMEGYGDAAAELTKQLGKHYDEERLANERNS